MEDALISAVFEREPLWDPTNEFHKNAVVLKKIWEEVAGDLQKDVKTVKARWKNLRAYFFKEHQKIKKHKSEVADKSFNSTTWQYYDQLMFLRSKRNSTENSDSNDETSVDEIQNPGSVQSSFGPETIASQNRVSQSRVSSRPPKRTTGRLENEKCYQIKKKKLVILDSENLKRKSDDLLFFESLLPYMENISLVRKLRLRSKIQDLIQTEIETVETDNRHEVPVIQ